MFPRTWRAVLALCCALSAVSCATDRPWSNAPLVQGQRVQYDGMQQLFDPSRQPDLLVVAHFSGGGSRAAALAHAVLSELDATPFMWRGRPTTLAREIDMVTGVSGGSVAAAHLAAQGLQDHLQRFQRDFLSIDFQRRLMGAMLQPGNLQRMSSPWFGRGHLLAQELDATLFHGLNFGQLAALKGRPYLIVGATDLSSGAAFNFTSDRLALLCSSVDEVPLALAVAASSAVPLLFSPITLHNHSRECPQRMHSGPNAESISDGPARTRLVQAESNTLALGQRGFVHLVDGGMSDNLGTRRLTDYVAKAGGIGAIMTLLAAGSAASGTVPRHIVFLSVNSESNDGMAIDQSDAVPGPIAVFQAMVQASLGRSSKETSLVFSEAVETWRKELRADKRWVGPLQPDIYAIEIKLTDLDDAQLRQQVLAIPTEFRISTQNRALLQMAARRSLEQSTEYRRFLASLPSGP